MAKPANAIAMSRFCSSVPLNELIASSTSTIMNHCHPADVELFRKTLSTVSASPKMRHVIITSLSLRATHEMKHVLKWFDNITRGIVVPLELPVNAKRPKIEKQFISAYKTFSKRRLESVGMAFETPYKIPPEQQSQLMTIIAPLPPQLIIDLSTFLTNFHSRIDDVNYASHVNMLVDDLMESLAYHRSVALKLFRFLGLSEQLQLRASTWGHRRRDTVLGLLRKQMSL